MEKRKSLTTKVLYVVLAIVVFSGGATGIIGYFLNRNTVIADYGRQATAMAQSVAAQIDPVKYRASIDGGVKDDYWHEVQNNFSKVRTETRALWVYSVFKGARDTDIFIFADGTDYMGQLPPNNEFLDALSTSDYPEELNFTYGTGVAAGSGVYDGGGYGTAVAGYAAIKYENGAVAGVVGVEIGVGDINASAGTFGLFILLTIAGFGALFLILGAYAGDKILKKPIYQLTVASDKLTQGDMDIQLDVRSQTELGFLSSDFQQLANTINRLIQAIRAMTKAHEDGDMDAVINAGEFNGVYRDVALEINAMVGSYVRHMLDVSEVLREFGEGNFNKEYPELPGKKSVSNEVVEELRQRLRDVEKEIGDLSKAARAGDFEARADAGKYNGDWAALLTELNSLVKSVADKAGWYESLLDSVPLPIFATDANMNWTFVNRALEKMGNLTRKEALGKPCNAMHTVICKTDNCAINNFKRGIIPTKFEQDGVHYQVNVAGLKDEYGRPTGFVEIIQDNTGITNMLNNLSDLVSNVKQASDQVTNSARQIADSSQHLAEGAASQSSSVEELNANLTIINEKTHSNAKITAEAKELSGRARQNALTGNQQMQEMLDAMTGIKAASDNIAKIIKTIDEIAFQTNLLSLNASVEAARAGEHGKGFAVVANEVGTLASRSQVAAKETEKLISESIKSVENGTTIAKNTAQSLSTIVSDFETVSALIEEIAKTSSEQAESIGQITEGVAQISNVTQENSASSEQTAAASQELASQADVLRGMVSGY